MAAPKKAQKNNKERILEAAIELMNEHGGAVGTSQIATHLGISPGNLYYHFRNREKILWELFNRLTTELLDVLRITPEEDVSTERLASCFIGGAHVLWRYRFFFAVDYLRRDDDLAEAYRDMSRRSKGYMKVIIQHALKAAPGQCTASDRDCERLAENMWVLWISWPRYSELDADVVREYDIWRGLEQIAFLLNPYLAKDYYTKVSRQLHRLTLNIERQG